MSKHTSNQGIHGQNNDSNPVIMNQTEKLKKLKSLCCQGARHIEPHYKTLHTFKIGKRKNSNSFRGQIPSELRKEMLGNHYTENKL